MDGYDNPDHGKRMFDGVRVVDRPFTGANVQQVSSVAPDGGPIFPATEDVQISSVPT